MTPIKIDHINIVVNDIATTRDFFITCFDFKQTLDACLSGKWISDMMGFENVNTDCIFLELPNGGCRIELLKFHTPAMEANPINHLNTQGIRHFAIEVKGIDEVLARVKNMGYDYLSPPSEVPRTILPQGKRLFYIKGPEGIIVETAEYG